MAVHSSKSGQHTENFVSNQKKGGPEKGRVDQVATFIYVWVVLAST